MVLAKLPCGVIYTDAFSHFIQGVHEIEAPARRGFVLTLDYVRCATGPKRGSAWFQLRWIPERAAPSYRCFHLGGVLVHFPKATQLGLRERCLDLDAGRVVVRP